MPPKKNHIGEKYGYLEVIAEAPPQVSGEYKQASTCWRVLCHNCGRKKVMRWQNIKKARSCGCINANTIKKEKTCDMCGALFQGNRTTLYCPECRKKLQEESGRNGGSPVQINMRCELCGKSFIAGSAVAKYCPSCRKIARRKHNQESYSRTKEGTGRKIGEEYPCASCGKLFVLKCGFQKYCPDCEELYLIRSWKDFREKYKEK